SARIGQRAEIALKARNGSLSSIRLPAQRIASQANFKSQKPICDSPAVNGEKKTASPKFQTTKKAGNARLPLSVA
ncbi:hypothetical protein, partial [Mesorhizobium sp. M2D.F.Ca.ET.140.01.1.1]